MIGDDFMIIKPSTSLRNNYTEISNLVKESSEPIYITKNGEGDMVIMDIKDFHRRERLLDLKEKLLVAEEQRIRGEETLTLDEVYKKMSAKINEKI